MTTPRERIIAPFLSEHCAHPRHVHSSWPCGVARSFGSICLHQKERRAGERFPGKAPEVLHVPDNHFEIQKVSLVEQCPRVIKDRVPKNTTWLVLDHHPLYRTCRFSKATCRMFEHLFKALLDHAWSETEPPAIRISSRKAIPHIVTRFQRSTRVL